MFDPKAYSRDFFATMTLYTISLFCSIWILNHVELGAILKLIVALLPMVPAIMATLVILHHFRKLDEMQMRIQVEAFCASALITGLLTFSLGFAQNAGVAPLPLIWVLPIMIGLWGAFAFIIRLRYIGK